MKTIQIEKANEEKTFFEKHGLSKGIGIIKRAGLSLLFKSIKFEKWFKVNNYKLKLNWDINTIANDIYVMGSREKLETYIMKKEIKKGDVCLEVGANIGYYAFLEAKVPKTKIFAFEPDERNIKLLNEGIIKNRLNNIFVYPDALSNYVGIQDLYLSQQTNINSMVKHDMLNGQIVKVKVNTVDNFSKGRKIDLIRMDVEGFEYEVFCGMNNIINSKAPLKIMVEFHFNQYSQERDFAKKLLELKNNNFICKYVVTQEKPLIEEMKSLGYTPEIIVNDSPNTRALYKNVDIKDVSDLIKKGNLLRAGFFERK